MLRVLAIALLASVSAPAGGPAPQPPSASAWAPPLPRPLTVSRGFDDPERYGPGHRGVDLATRPGASVRTPGTGTVRFAGPVAGRGVVSIDVAGLRFSYEPVIPRVRAGQPVRAGAVLGVVLPGHPGCRAGPELVCLHWGVRDGSRYLDPLRPLVVRARLLPLLAPPQQGSASPTAPSPRAG